MGHSIRAALAVGLPWAVFLATGSAVYAMWIYFGALRAAMSERDGDYYARFKPTVIGPLIGAVGFLATHLSTMPWAVTVIIMAIAGYLAAILSSYSSLLSAGATQAMLVACLSIGLPEIASGWEPVLLYLSGVFLYAGLLGMEMVCSPGAKRSNAATDLVAALGELAARRAAAPPDNAIGKLEIEAARRAVTARFAALGTLAMRAASQHFGRGDDAARLAAIMARSDAVFAAIMAAEDRGELQAAANTLRAAAAGASLPARETGSPMDAAIAALLGSLGGEDTQASGTADTVFTSHRPPVRFRLGALIDQLAPSRAVMMSATAVALCLGIAYAARWLDGAEHWFWIPLTVSMVMKPDLGSVFARAVLRVAGTIIGAAIGAVILLLIPKGVWLALPLAIFAGLAPLAAQRSYGLLTVAVTPIILIAISTTETGPVDATYVIQRIIDTAIGGAIALIFGYFIWPRTHYNRLSADFYRAKKHVADYILAAASPDDGSVDRLPAARRQAYRNLMDIRTHLRTALAEPPPASNEAAAWFPLIAAAARICDHVTAYAASAERPASEVDAKALEQLAAFVAAAPEERRHRTQPSSAGCSGRLVELFRETERELQHMDRLRDDRTFLATMKPRRARAAVRR